MYKYIFVCKEKCAGMSCKFIMKEIRNLDTQTISSYTEKLNNVCIQGEQVCRWKYKEVKSI